MNNVKRVMFRSQEMIMPNHVTLESVSRSCNIRCVMCPIEVMTRPAGIMSDETFSLIVDQLEPFKEHIQYVSLHLSGEPMMDKGLAQKVAVLKQRGFNGVGFASNCTLLTAKKSEELVQAGLDTLICSIDGFRKETHEQIRLGANFEKVVENVLQCIAIRNRLQGSTKIMIRFVRQALNQEEWPAFKAYWEEQLDLGRGDKILLQFVHNIGGMVDVKPVQGEEQRTSFEDIRVCNELYSRLIVLADGRVGLCCVDCNEAIKIGSIHDAHFLELYNNATFQHYRRMMAEGRIRELELCDTCAVPQNSADRKEY